MVKNNTYLVDPPTPSHGGCYVRIVAIQRRAAPFAEPVFFDVVKEMLRML